MENVIKKKNHFDEILTSSYIFQPMTPSKWIGEPEYQNIMIIGLSYGGGVGGSYRKLYCKRINNVLDVVRENEFFEVNLIDGTKEIINRRFIVTIKSDYQLMTSYLDSSNPNFEKGIYQYNYLVPNGHKVTLRERR